MGNMYPDDEVLRSVTLLCVQEFTIDSLHVVFMLGNKVRLPSPKQPAFASRRIPCIADTSSSNERSNSTNDMSLAAVEARWLQFSSRIGTISKFIHAIRLH
ncbi:hypothetical protein CDL15_Pgr016983 [Punica granatum]|uniref:S-locus receptor kinase C-terminal domain-containing protein n=1 Tax=Punica granatum TaxID=22663 RepID=A0A218WXJ2_PUNGR|nr:hypothetical protein CDL15_Pgr016983 [Punica granatum]